MLRNQKRKAINKYNFSSLLLEVVKKKKKKIESVKGRRRVTSWKWKSNGRWELNRQREGEFTTKDQKTTVTTMPILMATNTHSQYNIYSPYNIP